MSAIQQYPFGYLALLNAKSSGVTPPTIDDIVKPSLEMAPFFLASIPLTSLTATNAAAQAVGAAATLTVPSGEAWALVSLVAQATGGTAGDVLSFAASIAAPDGTSGAAIAFSAPLTIVNAGQVVFLPWTAQVPFILGPGTSISAVNALALAHALSLSVRALYRPLSV